ncbi:thymidylate kinase [Roseivivax marinus]|jgi:dTMP kinase|uniref:Thymidylate kinase n=1 Tax=Roseivivax marinus TaxID=1379903 RepID=W4HKB9_9RHOB|nr:dTMP kinase [Roseivivax marinus]ETW13174.1 thymidylate kinase [Roseivivax marinus]UMA63326.1 dTMP kinase [Roseivivax marinus]SEL94059.1 thymidylate kinase [Roseivivax marinus]
MPQDKRYGAFLTFEGIDGSGKSTQARLLAEALRQNGHDVLLTREPGGSPGAEEIRSLLLHGEPDRWSAETELLLFTAARRDHVERTIQPALDAGKIVICDRFVDSTRAYQGITRGDLRARVDTLHALMIGIEPDLTFLIDINPNIALARATKRVGAEARFESFGIELQATLRAGFLNLANRSRRFRVIAGNRPEAEVAEEVHHHATGFLGPLDVVPV